MALNYLLDPLFQIENSAGKPATGGWLEVYIHGTRTKYYCASDFDGTLHPFKIPLDSLGSNIVLADDSQAYDIYAYNRYGSLLMSRYNVAPGQGGGSGGGGTVGKVHYLKAVYDGLADMRAPYSYWIVDLERPNANSPYGYDYAMADEIIAQLSAGEIFALSTYPTAPSPEEDLYIMSSSALQSREGHEAVRIWFTRMFASNSPEYMYFTTIYTPSMYNSNPDTNYPEGRMAILNWRGQQDSSSEFRIMPYTELAEVATSGSYDDLSDKPSIPAAQVQSDWSQSDSQAVDYIKNKPDLALKENVSNKAQTINTSSTTEYPSSKAVADFVNSSVATNTANFLGTVAESSLGLDYTATNAQIALALDVHSWGSQPTNNDYCFVSVNDPQTTDIDEYRRFKFNGSVWAYEYTLNNSSFTQAQWNAINSGIDSTDKAAYDAAVDLIDDHVNDFNNPHNVTATQVGAESASNKAQVLDTTSTTEYPSSKAVGDYLSQFSVAIKERFINWADASSYAGGSTDRYFKLAELSSETIQNNINNVWRVLVSTDSVIETAYLRLKVRLNASGSQPIGELYLSPIGSWSGAASFTLRLQGTAGNVNVSIWSHHEGGYRSTVISDLGGGSFSLTSAVKQNWTYTSYSNNGSSAIPSGAQIIAAVVEGNKRITDNVNLAMTHNTSTDSINVISLYDYKFYNGHEYHTFISIPSGIQLANYSKDKVILAIWIGANNYASAPFNMRLRCNVANNVVTSSANIIPIDWMGENLSSTVSLDYMHISFFDVDTDNLVNMAANQTLGFSARGTESYVQ